MEVVLYPHPALRWKSKPITRIDSELRKTVAQMFELMYEHRGIGLACNQVALPYRMFVINLTSDPAAKDEELVFINPEISHRKGSAEEEEGCLSLPKLFADVKRAEEITVSAFDLSGNEFELTTDDLGARAIQHENDHLDGVLFVDRLSESTRREVEPVLADFETLFRRRQQQGEYPADDAIRKHLAEIEPK